MDFTMQCTVLCLALVAGTAMSKTLMLGGGYISDGNSIIWNRAISLAGGRGVAKIGIITAGSGSAINQGREYKAMFESYGAKEAYWIPIHENNLEAASKPEVLKKIKEMTGIFFGGGLQQKYKENLMNGNHSTPALAQIKQMYDTGTVVIATSAGAMVMPGDFNMVDGTSYGALVSGAKKVGEGENAADLIYDPEGGFGFINGHIIDTHFSERGRQGRLIRLLSHTKDINNTNYGFGIDEETAIVITDVDTPKSMGEVIGNAGITYIDVSKSYVDQGDVNWRVLSVLMHYGGPGDKVNFSKGTITFPNKKCIKGQETEDYAATSANIFQSTFSSGKSQFRHVAESLFNSRYDSITYGTSSEFFPTFYVIMTKDSKSKGYVEVDSTQTTIGYINMKVEIRGAVPADDDGDEF